MLAIRLRIVTTTNDRKTPRKPEENINMINKSSAFILSLCVRGTFFQPEHRNKSRWVDSLRAAVSFSFEEKKIRDLCTQVSGSAEML